MARELYRYSSTSTTFHKKVLIAVDGSKHSDYAFQWYIDNIKRYGDFVILLHCIDAHSPTNLATDANNGDLFANMTTEGRAHEQEFHDKFTKKMKDARLHGLVKKTTGSARTEILRVAEEEDVDLIITGTRGLGSVRRTMLGSVSDHVLHHAHVPVLVCRNKHESRSESRSEKHKKLSAT